MEDIMIRAKSFSDARKSLAQRFHKNWIPIRIWESNVFRFVDIDDIVPKHKDIDYNKIIKKLKKSITND